MTEPALRDPSAAGAWLMRGLPNPPRMSGGTDLVPVPDAPRDASSKPEAEARPSGRRDWSASLDLIHEATEAIRISEARASELEQELAHTVAQAQERARVLEAQIAVAQNRAELAERRADEAEEWLGRLHDAVVTGFTRREAPAESPSPESSAA